jgi:hypothetical protein
MPPAVLIVTRAMRKLLLLIAGSAPLLFPPRAFHTPRCIHHPPGRQTTPSVAGLLSGPVPAGTRRLAAAVSVPHRGMPRSPARAPPRSMMRFGSALALVQFSPAHAMLR